MAKWRIETWLERWRKSFDSLFVDTNSIYIVESFYAKGLLRLASVETISKSQNKKYIILYFCLLSFDVFTLSIMRINTNLQSIISNHKLRVNSFHIQSAIQKLSTGKKINNASDDPAGVALINRFSSQISGSYKAIENAQDGISMLKTMDSALVGIEEMLLRMRDLTVKANNDAIVTDAERNILNVEYNSLLDEIDRIAQATTFNSKNVLSGNPKGTTATIQGNNGSWQSIGLTMEAGETVYFTAQGGVSVSGGGSALYGPDGDQSASFLTDGTFPLAGVRMYTLLAKINGQPNNTATVIGGYGKFTAPVGGDVVCVVNDTLYGDNGGQHFVTFDAAQKLQIGPNSDHNIKIVLPNVSTESLNVALTRDRLVNRIWNDWYNPIPYIDSAIQRISDIRADIGQEENQLHRITEELYSNTANLSKVRSRIEDTDFAAETASFAKAITSQQTTAYIAAQANAVPQRVLTLLSSNVIGPGRGSKW